MSFLNINKLDIEYQTRKETINACKNVSLSLERGEIIGVVGESGSGKSTVANAIINLIDKPGKITSGSIKLDEVELCNNEDVKKVENIITKYKLPNSIKTLDNLKFNYKNVFKTLYADKKVKNGKLTFVLPKGIGNAILKNNIKEKIILDFLKEEINE